MSEATAPNPGTFVTDGERNGIVCHEASGIGTYVIFADPLSISGSSEEPWSAMWEIAVAAGRSACE